MVPSGGFSPPTIRFDSSAETKSPAQPGFGQNLGSFEDNMSYSNLADSFDLSLLGDFCNDHDMATVPSPSWSPSASTEPVAWQQLSFYAASPGSDFQAFSPDCKPVLSPAHQTFGGEQMMAACLSPASSVNSPSDGSQAMDNMDGDRHLVLRQCLEDTSFQRKCNFKPLELSTTALSVESNSYDNNSRVSEWKMVIHLWDKK